MIQCNETLVRDDRSQDWQNRTAARANRGTLRVWLVDNDQEFCSLLARLLVLGGGIECPRSFPSAEAVLDALPCEKAPDVILLDIDMGGMSGLDAIRPIKARAGATHIFMLTAFYDSQRRCRALRDGATDFLLKMDTVEKISKRIQQTPEQGAESVPGLGWGTAVPGAADGAPPGSALTDWPRRRAPEYTIGRSSNHDVTQQHPDRGRRSVPWRSASSRLVRGVGYLRDLFGPGPAPTR